MGEEWRDIDITTPADREAVALALFRAGYTVRLRRRKEGNKTMIYLEYRKGVGTC